MPWKSVIGSEKTSSPDSGVVEGNMVTLYKVVYGSPVPVEVLADKGSQWPHSDTDGETIYKNTHFRNLNDAWKQHLAEHKAALSLAAAELVQARERVAAAEKRCADAGITCDVVLRAYDEFKSNGSEK
jgi:hypothetical protein